MITSLSYEMSVLVKSIQHKNLSAAAVHVGLSQPQLSRVIAKLEGEFGVTLLDRSARRKSGWTPVAQELAALFSRGMGRLQAEIVALTKQKELSEIHIGTLEGLAGIAQDFAKSCFKELGIKVIHLDVLDFKDLDSQFLSGSLDLIFTVRPPSKQKHAHMIEVGYQQMEKVVTNKDIQVLSPFELSGLDKKTKDQTSHILISNSLAVRSQWLKNIGGTGTLPVDARKGKGKGFYSVYLIGSDLISAPQWAQFSSVLD